MMIKGYKWARFAFSSPTGIEGENAKQESDLKEQQKHSKLHVGLG